MRIREMLAIALVAAAFALFGAGKSITLGAVRSHVPWDGKYDVEYTLDLPEEGALYEVSIHVKPGESKASFGKTVLVNEGKLESKTYVTTIDMVELLDGMTFLERNASITASLTKCVPKEEPPAPSSEPPSVTLADILDGATAFPTSPLAGSAPKDAWITDDGRMCYRCESPKPCLVFANGGTIFTVPLDGAAEDNAYRADGYTVTLVRDLWILNGAMDDRESIVFAGEGADKVPYNGTYTVPVEVALATSPVEYTSGEPLTMTVTVRNRSGAEFDDFQISDNLCSRSDGTPRMVYGNGTLTCSVNGAPAVPLNCLTESPLVSRAFAIPAHGTAVLTYVVTPDGSTAQAAAISNSRVEVIGGPQTSSRVSARLTIVNANSPLRPGPPLQPGGLPR